VAAVFGGEEAIRADETDEPEPEQPAPTEHSEEQPFVSAAHGTIEEEEIDEEEADLIAYVEELAEDEAFDDLEEETHSAGDFAESEQEQAIAAAEDGEVPFSAEPVAE